MSDTIQAILISDSELRFMRELEPTDDLRLFVEGATVIKLTEQVIPDKATTGIPKRRWVQVEWEDA